MEKEKKMTFSLSPDLKGCQHQFFEIEELNEKPIGSTVWKSGKLVMCAVCGERRQLWNNGDMLFFIDGNWQKLPGM